MRIGTGTGAEPGHEPVDAGQHTAFEVEDVGPGLPLCPGDRLVHQQARYPARARAVEPGVHQDRGAVAEQHEHLAPADPVGVRRGEAQRRFRTPDAQPGCAPRGHGGGRLADHRAGEVERVERGAAHGVLPGRDPDVVPGGGHVPVTGIEAVAQRQCAGVPTEQLGARFGQGGHLAEARIHRDLRRRHAGRERFGHREDGAVAVHGVQPRVNPR